jgi:hypothetical protein
MVMPQECNAYKGGTPAQCWCRLSSVLDVSMKEGNNQKKYQVEGGLGLIVTVLCKALLYIEVFVYHFWKAYLCRCVGKRIYCGNLFLLGHYFTTQ